MRTYLLRHDPSVGTARSPGLLVPTDSLKTDSVAITHDLPETSRLCASSPARHDFLPWPERPCCRSNPSPAWTESLRPSDACNLGVARHGAHPARRGSQVGAEPIVGRLGPGAGHLPHALSLPVLLDIDPAAASGENAGVPVELRLLRPKTGRGPANEPKPPVSLWPDPKALGTLTDLYELTMMAGYHAAGMAGQKATFELFVRKMPPGRAFLVFAGLEQAIGDLLDLAFDPEQIDDIRRWPAFPRPRSRSHGQAGRHAFRR